MSAPIDNGGPAFPQSKEIQDGYADAGMSLRDWFAGQALTGLIAAESHPEGHVDFGDIPDRAKYAYMQADAMLTQRAKQSQ